MEGTSHTLIVLQKYVIISVSSNLRWK